MSRDEITSRMPGTLHHTKLLVGLLKIILLKLLKIPQMGKVNVVNRVDMLSFAITSEEEDTEKVDADSHSDSSSEDELVKLEVCQPDNFRDIAHGSFVLHRGLFPIDPANRPRCGKRPNIYACLAQCIQTCNACMNINALMP